MKYLSAIILSMCVSAPSFADVAEARISSNTCLKENITLKIRYKLKGSSFDEIKKIIDKKDTEIKEYAKQQKLPSLKLRKKNYNIHAYSNSYYSKLGTPESLAYSGNAYISYMLNDVNAAFKLSELLISQKIQVSISSNMRKQGNCTQPSIETVRPHTQKR